jgi:DNA primase
MRFSPNFLDEIRARVPVSHVVGRKVALKKAGREYKGLSPFKAEKTPSFTVNDQKGFYHCFASGEHGDIFTFLMKIEGLEFPEAVERLAAEAGVPMPKPTERNVEQEDQRERLYRLLETSARYFEQSLRGSAGHGARQYLERRGLAPEAIATFRLGFAPSHRTALRDHLKAAGFSISDMTVAGMIIAGEDIPEPYDRFRNRVMFPIQDLKGRVIAFGGRALEKDAPAKYLNSPETPLFHKGHTLFNAARARPASHDKGRVIAVEGYMDVIALHEGGFAETVAPLGTALTEDQLKLLWRFASEPILCFDGDAAGRKAAYRAIDTALPWLGPDRSVAFAFLPQGADPDDFVRQQGATAFDDVLAKRRPLVDVLWEREAATASIATPEQRAGLDTKIRALVALIQDSQVRLHYEREMRNRLYQLIRGPAASFATGKDARRRRGSTDARAAQPLVDPGWRRRERDRLAPPGRRPKLEVPQPPIATAELSNHVQTVAPREAVILKTILNHPWLIDEHSELVASLEISSRPLAALRDEILSIHAQKNSLDTASLRSQLTKSGVAKVVDLVARTITHISDRFAEPDASAADVETAWHHIIALHHRQVALERELRAAEEQWYRDCTEEAETRLLDVKRRMARSAAAEELEADPGQSG